MWIALHSEKGLEPLSAYCVSGTKKMEEKGRRKLSASAQVYWAMEDAEIRVLGANIFWQVSP